MAATIYSDDHHYLIEQLKKARHKAGLSQKEAAKLLGKTQSYISRIEAGQRRVDIVQLKEFGTIYNKKINYFIKE